MPANPTSVSANLWKAEVSPDNITWTEVKGLDTITPSRTSSDIDDTTFSNAGFTSSITVAYGEAFTIAGQYLEDTTSANFAAGKGVRDPGQAMLESSSKLIGAARFLYARLTSPGGGSWKGIANIGAVTSGGGGKNTLSPFSAAFSWRQPPVYTPPA